jgi:hypothetical protein
MQGPPLLLLKYTTMIKFTITKFTGVGQPTVVVADQGHVATQGAPKRPALRLIQGGA